MLLLGLIRESLLQKEAHTYNYVVLNCSWRNTSRAIICRFPPPTPFPPLKIDYFIPSLLVNIREDSTVIIYLKREEWSEKRDFADKCH